MMRPRKPPIVIRSRSQTPATSAAKSGAVALMIEAKPAVTNSVE